MSKEIFFVLKEDQNSMKSKIKERNNPDSILLKNEDLLLKSQIAQINGINMPKKLLIQTTVICQQNKLMKRII